MVLRAGFELYKYWTFFVTSDCLLFGPSILDNKVIKKQLKELEMKVLFKRLNTKPPVIYQRKTNPTDKPATL